MAADIWGLARNQYWMTSLMMDGMALIAPPAVTLNACKHKECQHVFFISQMNQLTYKTNISLSKCILKSSYCALWTQIMRGLQSPITKGLCDKSMNSTKLPWVFSKCLHYFAIRGVCCFYFFVTYLFLFKIQSNWQKQVTMKLLSRHFEGNTSSVRSAESNVMCSLKWKRRNREILL